MAWVSQHTWLVGETVTATNLNTYLRDDSEWLRAMTGNGSPPAADYVVVSTSTVLTAWSKVTSAMIAVGAVGSSQIGLGAVGASQLGAGQVQAGHIANGNVADVHMANQKVNRTGDTMTGNLSFDPNYTVRFAQVNQLKIAYTSNEDYAVGVVNGELWQKAPSLHRWYKFGNGGIYAELDMGSGSSSGAILRVGGFTVWHAGNMGSGSGLNADLLDGNDASAFLTSGALANYVQNSSSPTFGTVTANAVNMPNGNNNMFISNTNEIAWNLNGGQRVRFEASKAVFSVRGEYVTSWNNVSDRRLKTAIETVTGGLERLRMLRPVTYVPSAEGIAEGMTRGERRPAFIAQELAEVFPELIATRLSVVDHTTPLLSVDQIGLIPYVVDALDELHDRVRVLEMA